MRFCTSVKNGESFLRLDKLFNEFGSHAEFLEEKIGNYYNESTVFIVKYVYGGRVYTGKLVRVGKCLTSERICVIYHIFTSM